MSRDFSTVADDFASEKKPSGSPAFHFDPKRFLNLRLPAIAIISLVLGLPLALAGWFLTPVEFTATAQIQYRSIGTGIVQNDLSRSGAGDYAKFVNTEIAKLTGDNVLQKVLERPEVTSLPSIQAVSDRLTFLKDRISARLLSNSELVVVSCTMQTRYEALQLLEIVVDIYERQAMVDEQTEGSVKIEIINEKIEDKEKDLAIQRQAIQELEGALGASFGSVLPRDSKEAEQYRQEVLLSERRITDAQNSVESIEDRIARLEAHQEANRANPGDPIYEFGVEDLVGRDPAVATLEQSVVRTQSEVDLLRETHKEGHARLRAQERNLASMKRNLEAQKSLARAEALRTLRGRFANELEDARRQVEEERTTLAENRERYEDFVSMESTKLTQASEERARLQQLREQADLDRELLSSWRTQVQNMQLEGEAPARVRVAAAPYAPQAQGIAKKLMMALLGLLAGTAAGVAYGVIRELFDQQIRTPRDIARITNLPIIASIPHRSEDRMLPETDMALLMAQHPNSIIADEYRRILARLLFPEDNAAEISSLLVVSASPGEGKTSLACNLAVALEQANRRVLLIDLSSQRPCVEVTFGLSPSLGLADLLQNGDSRDELIRRTAFENLGVLGPGTDLSDLSGRLASREMMDFMEWADEHFDHIIVDSPPLRLMSDAKLLAPAVDGVLFVVGAGSSTLGMVSRCLRELDVLRANTVGIVLNGIRSMRGGYLRKNRNLFYAYTDTGSFGTGTGEMPEINIVEDESEESDEAVVLLPVDKRDS